MYSLWTSRRCAFRSPRARFPLEICREGIVVLHARSRFVKWNFYNKYFLFFTLLPYVRKTFSRYHAIINRVISVDIILRHEAVEKAKPGDRCLFTGTIVVVPDIAQLSASGMSTAQCHVRVELLVCIIFWHSCLRSPGMVIQEMLLSLYFISFTNLLFTNTPQCTNLAISYRLPRT